MLYGRIGIGRKDLRLRTGAFGEQMQSWSGICFLGWISFARVVLASGGSSDPVKADEGVDLVS